MTDFTVRSDAVDVEDIMQRIRARIREKRGVDYTEEEIRTIATAKLERFLDPSSVRSDLIGHYRNAQPPRPVAPNYAFEDSTIYASSDSAAGRLIRRIRRLLNPVLKLFFNPNPIIRVLHMQSDINKGVAEQIAVHHEMNALSYEVLNNLVVELTRLGIEVKNLKMQVESLSGRLDFDERRARALEGAVEYRPDTTRAGGEGATGAVSESSADKDGQRPRRRRRRGRRRGTPQTDAAGDGPTPSSTDSVQTSAPSPAASDADGPAPGDADTSEPPEPPEQ